MPCCHSANVRGRSHQTPALVYQINSSNSSPVANTGEGAAVGPHQEKMGTFPPFLAHNLRVTEDRLQLNPE